MKNKTGRFEILIGALMLAAALVLSGHNMLQQQSAAAFSSAAAVQIKEQLTEEQAEMSAFLQTATERGTVIYPDYRLNPEMPMPTMMIDGNSYVALLEIPAIDLELPILEEFSYPGLKKAPCRYTGSIYTRNLVICAHNYARHFGSLSKLSDGDRVKLVDGDGNEFFYEVREIVVLDPDQTEEFTESGYDLTLFTCTISGTSRVTVRCDLVEERPIEGTITQDYGIGSF